MKILKHWGNKLLQHTIIVANNVGEKPAQINFVTAVSRSVNPNILFIQPNFISALRA